MKLPQAEERSELGYVYLEFLSEFVVLGDRAANWKSCPRMGGP
jgi:hypothetical protein